MVIEEEMNKSENVRKKEEESDKVDLDTILVKEIGQFGTFQLRTVAASALVVLFIAWSATEYLFTTSRITTRCLIPECESKDEAIFTPSWISNAIPESGSSFDNCQRFGSNTTQSALETCPKYIFNRDEIISCEEFVYQNTHSVVYDFNLACDEWRRTLIGSIRTIGTLLALPITGFISDRWGRRTAIILTAINTAWLGLIRYWSNTYVTFLLSEVAEATFGSGGFSSCYILLMEIVGPKYRVAAGATMNTFFAVGQMTTGLLAWAVPDWRNLTLTLYIPQFITLSYFWIMSESVRWYLSKGRYDDAANVLRRAAKVNRRELCEKSLRALENCAKKENARKESKELNGNNEPWLPVLVYRHKAILKRVLISPVWWITTTFVYYGLSINSINMVGNRYLNFVLVSAAEIPGYWTAFFLMGKIGRRPVLIGAYWICAICQIGYIFMPQGLYEVSLTVYLIGKFAISMVITCVYVYTAELYPTRYRHSLFAFSSMIGRIGSIIAPLTPAFGAAVWEDLPFALFAGFSLLSGLLVFLTPETLGTTLPDTMKEASRIGDENISR